MLKCPEMTESDRILTAAQERALSALLSERTIQGASEASGVPYRTITRWMQQEPFSQAYRARLDALVNDAASSLKKSLTGAVEVLREIAENAEAPPNARISAARTLLDSGLRYIETLDIIQRLEAVEDAVADNQKTN